MSIFYYNEHAECPNYMSDVRVGFKYIEVDEGSIFNIEDKQDKHIFFFLTGNAKVRYNEFSDRLFGAGEMIFLPKSADCYGVAITKCTFIVLVYDNPMKLCNKVGLNSIISCAKDVKYEFRSLPIRAELMQFLNLLRVYLLDGISCRHLHEMKQKELFILFRGYYRKEELAQFFFPMIGKSMDFRSTVMTHYINVKTVKELSQFCGYSKSRFHDLFIEEFGQPPYQWMQKQKSKHIIGRLSQTQIPLKDIADEFNFSCPSHFNKYCKAQYGNTAARVRQNLNAEKETIKT